ncbi:trypsin-like peptidase domain-containing protein [Undibacter mobilis]|uniref:Serine protease n=1 Tax=Undibacter mobilis TaxID=2292256 RepID=A0A371BCK2_9BRAD|nr:trypsin-like peptidase domain-containing protein [Undibacter mobilis]RDV05304.1 hypothetical protein DXH78_12410 [Undibacter mobilis]
MSIAGVRVAFLGAVALTLFCDASLGADRHPRLLAKPQRSVPILVPIGCLMSERCGESGFEGTSKGSVVTAKDIARDGVAISDRTSSDPRVYGVNDAAARAAAARYLAQVRNELRKLTPAQLLSRRDRPPGQGIIGPAPPRLRSKTARYLAGNDFFNCKSIFVAMRRAQNISSVKQRSELMWALYQHYIDSCHGDKLESLGGARARIVAFLRRDTLQGHYSLYCLGFNFVGNYVLTARHCLVEPGEVGLMLNRYKPSDPDAFIDIDGPLGGTRALVLGEPDKLYPVRLAAGFEQEKKLFPFAPEKDTFILEIDAPERPGLPAFPVADAAQWDEIAIPAIFPDDAVLSDAVMSGYGARVNDVINGASAVDTSPVCSLVYSRISKRPFVFHGCQTRYGYSGGPILRRGPRGAMTLVGVHTGAVDAKKPIDNWPYAVLFPNYGLRLPPQVMTSAKGEARRQ